ncbi:MAG: bifunctional hydroxymethylpyrimidine kinase/phosphomethylpyrimidine kinase [Armatimonadetes bacterium]|nr:bifunctional hydroxymethylpyrimidine kinase/phosphomethylpyrimidine kinase [Armatimonadota bacterium]
MSVAISIAASDSSGGAGIQADLAVFREIGIYGVCAVTSVTAQDSRGVHKINKVPPRIITAQIDAVTRDFYVSACKVGMLYSPQAVSVVAERIRRREIPNVVLDPVIRSKRGDVLLTEPAIKRLKYQMLPLAMLVTPNWDEASSLTGIEVRDYDSARQAALAIVEMGAKAALVKGGHAEGDPLDVLFYEQEFHTFVGKRIYKQMHGTGCVLSAAIAARLAMGDDLMSAITFGHRYVAQSIENSQKLGKGDVSFYVGAESKKRG